MAGLLMVRRLVKVTALAAVVWWLAASSGDIWRLVGWGGLSIREQLTLAAFQGGALGVCLGFFAREVGGTLFGGLRLPRRNAKPAPKRRRR
jgi:hypothetical protein